MTTPKPGRDFGHIPACDKCHGCGLRCRTCGKYLNDATHVVGEACVVVACVCQRVLKGVAK